MISERLPNRVILTDDPLRAKMLAAHHLEYSAPVFEQGDVFAFSGSYNNMPIALLSTGFGNDAIFNYLTEAKRLGATEIVFIGECISSTARYKLREVILAAGGSRSLLQRARDAALRFDIQATVRTVLPPEAAQPEDGCIIDGVSGGLYERAKTEGVEALSILTVTENTKTGEKAEEHERRSRLYAASRLVFEALVFV